MKHKNIYRISISLLLAFVMALPTIAQNTKTFKGVVLDETEQPIIGAAIKVVGTTVGTITDLDGNFTLNVPDGKEVEISYIGYVPQRFSAPFKLTKIILKEDTQQLDEVVVVGYGTQKKAHLTGAIATVPVDDIQDISSGSLASTLSGLANGISVNGGDTRPGQNATITIRQNGELEEMGGTNLQPLYVIDGYIYPTEVKVGSTYTNLGAEAFNNLDPSVVESISILKDASAAAINCSGLLELFQYVSEERAKKYYKAAEKMLQTLSSPAYTAEEGTNGGFILKHSVGNIPSGTEVDMPLTYADYYYVEALCRYKSLNDKP